MRCSGPDWRQWIASWLREIYRHLGYAAWFCNIPNIQNRFAQFRTRVSFGKKSEGTVAIDRLISKIHHSISDIFFWVNWSPMCTRHNKLCRGCVDWYPLPKSLWKERTRFREKSQPLAKFASRGANAFTRARSYCPIKLLCMAWLISENALSMWRRLSCFVNKSVA